MTAGTDLGRIADGHPFAGARLTVAGHDHLVAAEADGPIPPARYHVSMGTAEVLLRVIDAPLGCAARARLAKHLVNEVRHVVPGKHVLVAGLKSGLLMRRALQALGIRDADGRDRLDAAVMAIPYAGTLPGGGIEVSGARNDDGVLALTVRTDDVSPAEVFAAVLRHSNDEIARLVAAMDREVPPATSATLTGGWAAMASVCRARAAILPDVTVSDRRQETAYGAARVAARLLHPIPTHSGGTMNPLTTLERRGMTAISTAASRMLIVAADQRNSMKATMTDAPDGPGAITDAELAAAKADLVTLPRGQRARDPARPGGRAARASSTTERSPATPRWSSAWTRPAYETVDGLRYTRFVAGVTAAPRPRPRWRRRQDALVHSAPTVRARTPRVADEIRDLVQRLRGRGVCS